MTSQPPETIDTDISLADGALDTLGCVFQTMGNESFALDTDDDPNEFAALCAEIVRHIENGGPAPSFGLSSTDGLREWSVVRRFYVDRRKEEKTFVSGRLGDYRDIVEQFIVGLKAICAQNMETERLVSGCLSSIEVAISGGDLTQARDVLARAVSDIDNAFATQREQYERQISLLNERVDVLRDDLVATNEKMQLDSLTGVYNRGAFDEILQRYVNTRFLLDRPVSVVLIDIDNFKDVNDCLGHVGGDAVLKAVVNSMLRSFIRKNDIVARFGGDEFAVILPDTNSVESTASVERFLDAVRGIDVGSVLDDETAAPIAVTCSVGCAVLVEDDTAESVLHRADEAMYAAKEAGRDGYKVI